MKVKNKIKYRPKTWNIDTICVNLRKLYGPCIKEKEELFKKSRKGFFSK